MDTKRKIFSELNLVTDENTILASNTSSIGITGIAAATKKPDKVISGSSYSWDSRKAILILLLFNY